MYGMILSYVAALCNTNLPVHPQDIPPIVPTTEEKEFVCLQGDLIYVLT